MRIHGCSITALGLGVMAIGHPVAVTAQSSPTRRVQEFPQAESALTQDRAETQVTISPRWERLGSDRFISYHLGAEFGISDRWQLEGDLDLSSVKLGAFDGEAVSVSLGLRRSWRNVGNLGVNLAGNLESEWKMNDRGKEASGPSVGLGIAMSRDVGVRAEVVAAASLSRELSEADHDESLEMESHLGGRLSGRSMNLTSDSWLSSAIPGDDANHPFYTPGLIFFLPAGMELLIATPIQIGSSSLASSGLVKFTIEF